MKKLPSKLQPWADARKRFRLTHAQIQMARELGMNPKSLGSIDNHRQQPWKAPLAQFIENLYVRRFQRAAPAVVHSIEHLAQRDAERKLARRQRRNGEAAAADGGYAVALLGAPASPSANAQEPTRTSALPATPSSIDCVELSEFEWFFENFERQPSWDDD